MCLFTFFVTGHWQKGWRRRSEEEKCRASKGLGEEGGNVRGQKRERGQGQNRRWREGVRRMHEEGPDGGCVVRLGQPMGGTLVMSYESEILVGGHDRQCQGSSHHV